MKAPLDNLQFDSIIVGGGSAGCVLAHCPSAIPGRRVFLIEARQLQLLFATFRKATKSSAGIKRDCCGEIPRAAMIL